MHPLFLESCMKLKALKTYDFGGVVLKPGDEFEAKESIAKQLVALKQADFLEQPRNTDDLSEFVTLIEHEALQAAFDAFKNSPEDMMARIADLEAQTKINEDAVKSIAEDLSKLSNDELKTILTEKNIEFKQNSKKEDLLALIPLE